jgi:type II secretory pathway pseudopilin PulG
MQRWGGYTVIEVLIVLAISTVLFTVAVGLFSGKQNSTQFTQTMQDLASKIQSYVNESLSGSFPDSSSYSCTLDGDGNPVFSMGGGSNGDCVFLGKALQVSSDQSSITAYTIVGGRNSATTFEQANPTPAQLADGTDILTDNYDLAGAKIVSSKINTDTTTIYNLIGLYIDLGGSGAPDTSNSTGLFTRAYQFSDGTLKSCIAGNEPSCKSPSISDNFSKWNLCLQNGSHQMTVRTNATGSGVTTQVVDGCS